jgi:hypothetical protein
MAVQAETCSSTEDYGQVCKSERSNITHRDATLQTEYGIPLLGNKCMWFYLMEI